MTGTVPALPMGQRILGRLRSRTAVGLFAGHIAVAALVIAAFGMIERTATTTRPAPTGEIQRSADVERQYGIRLERIGMSADGGLIDLRYLTLDAHLASRIGQGVDIMIQDEASGTLLNTPAFGLHGRKHDAAMSPIREPGGQRRYILFRNAAGTITSGSVVTVLVGDVPVQHITVE